MPVFFLLSEYAVVKALKPLLWPLFLLTYEFFFKGKKHLYGVLNFLCRANQKFIL